MTHSGSTRPRRRRSDSWRRLGAESVGLIFAARGERRFEGLAKLVVEGLDDQDARTVLEVVAGPLDERVRARILAEAGGNPLALLELPRAEHPPSRGRVRAAGRARGVGRIEQSFRDRLAALPPSTRLLLLVAAAESVGIRRWSGVQPSGSRSGGRGGTRD